MCHSSEDSHFSFKASLSAQQIRRPLVNQTQRMDEIRPLQVVTSIPLHFQPPSTRPNNVDLTSTMYVEDVEEQDGLMGSGSPSKPMV
jgi:hypothetical protein